MNGNFSRLLIFAGVVAASLVLLFSIHLVQLKINKITVDNRLTDTGSVENAPPVVMFTTVALGSFRGLLADLLWLRATTLQEQGNYFEMVQLASWITKLQPRFTGATAYLAWNMAYNISVTFSSPEDRWRWVQRGIELIRDEALQYNPADPVLYKELGWIYQHKIGNIMDDANLYYKYQMAIQMMKVTGSADPDWNKLASAPRTKEELMKHYPPESPFEKALRVAGFNTLEELEQKFRETGKFPETFSAEFKNPAELMPLELYLRSKWLREVYKLNPSLIVEINNKYGKFDWRMPEAHAIYWATLGIEKSPDKKSIDCERMITQSLKEAFSAGRLLMIDNPEYQGRIMTVPNLNVVDAVKRTYEETAERNNGAKTFIDAKRNFMKEAVVTLYSFGNYTKAQDYMNMLKKEMPDNREFKVPLDQFVLTVWTETAKLASRRQANEIITGLIYTSCLFVVYGDMDAALAHERLALFVHTQYQKEQSLSAVRTGLPPFVSMKTQITKNLIANLPPELSAILQAHIKFENQETDNKVPSADVKK